jgi:hypothetical protein
MTLASQAIIWYTLLGISGPIYLYITPSHSYPIASSAVASLFLYLVSEVLKFIGAISPRKVSNTELGLDLVLHVVSSVATFFSALYVYLYESFCWGTVYYNSPALLFCWMRWMSWRTASDAIMQALAMIYFYRIVDNLEKLPSLHSLLGTFNIDKFDFILSNRVKAGRKRNQSARVNDSWSVAEIFNRLLPVSATFQLLISLRIERSFWRNLCFAREIDSIVLGAIPIIFAVLTSRMVKAVFQK